MQRLTFAEIILSEFCVSLQICKNYVPYNVYRTGNHKHTSAQTIFENKFTQNTTKFASTKMNPGKKVIWQE